MRRALAVAMVVASVGCADVLGLGDFHDVDASTDATFDAPADAAPDVIDAAPDVADAAADADSGCASETVDDSKGIFVTPSGSTDTATCGTETVPCASIQTGLDRAHEITGKSIVYVARGTYAESVSLYAGLQLEGGWDVLDHGQSKTWVQACSARSSAVVIQPTTGTTAVSAIDLGGAATVSDLTIKSKASAAPGESLYGVFAHGACTALTLSDVIVDVATGGDGTPGTNGVAGDAGASGCTPDLGDAGDVGETGAGAEAGAFADDGWHLASGSDGTNGTAGLAGSAGGAGACVTCGTCGGLFCPFKSNGQSCGGTGYAGCGGALGTAGTAGAGGGSSIGVFAWDATVTIQSSDVNVGGGGAGGAGGIGGAGGPGGPGALGDAGNACGVSCDNKCNEVLGAGQGGDAGGAGGSGGSGGNGGGGAGGCAYALYQGGSATITATTTTLEHGDAGAGGGPDGSAGSSGLAADRFP